MERTRFITVVETGNSIVNAVTVAQKFMGWVSNNWGCGEHVPTTDQLGFTYPRAVPGREFVPRPTPEEVLLREYRVVREEAIDSMDPPDWRLDISLRLNPDKSITIEWRGRFTPRRCIAVTVFPDGTGTIRAKTGTGKPSSFFGRSFLSEYLPDLCEIGEERIWYFRDRSGFPSWATSDPHNFGDASPCTEEENAAFEAVRCD